MFKQKQGCIRGVKCTPLELAILTEAIGETQRALGHFQEAEKCFKKRRLCDSLPPKQNVLSPEIFNNMALLYRDQGRFPEAEGLWKQNELTNRRILLRLIILLISISCGAKRRRTRLHEQSDKGGPKAIKVLAVPYSEFNQAVYAQQKGDFKTAGEHCTKAIEVCTRDYGEKHYYYTVILVDMAEGLRQQSRYAEAEKVSRKCLKIRRNFACRSSEHF